MLVCRVSSAVLVSAWALASGGCSKVLGFSEASHIDAGSDASTADTELSDARADASVHVDDRASEDFSATQNPAGNWSYGLKVSKTGAFTIHGNTAGVGVSGLDCWRDDGSDLFPYLCHNPGSSAVAYSNTTVPAGQLIMHPQGTELGAEQMAALRWTSPVTSTIDVVATFSRASSMGSTVQIVVVKGATTLFDDALDATNGTPVSALDLAIAAGESIDFLIAANGSMSDDGVIADVHIVNE